MRSYDGSLAPPEEITLRILRAFVEEVRRNDAVPVVIIFPTAATMAEHVREDQLPYHTLITQLGNEGIQVLDLSDSFGAAMQEKDVGFEAFISPVGGHYNEAGHRLVSQAILDYLVQSGLISR